MIHVFIHIGFYFSDIGPLTTVVGVVYVTSLIRVNLSVSAQ